MKKLRKLSCVKIAQSEHNVTPFCDNEPDIEGEIFERNEKNSSRTAEKRIFFSVLLNNPLRGNHRIMTSW